MKVCFYFALNLKKIDYWTQQNWKWIHFYPVETLEGEKIQVDFQTRDFTAVQKGDIAIQYTNPGESSLNITSWRLFKEVEKGKRLFIKGSSGTFRCF